MERVPEPELMDVPAQARAYAEADFSEPHDHFVELLGSRLGTVLKGHILDLGCGPGDICRRVARAFPDCRVLGVDGSRPMLDMAHAGRSGTAPDHRVDYRLGLLPDVALPEHDYRLIMSNSLLHHLRDPSILWQSLKRFGKPGTGVFVMDLSRPASRAIANRLVQQYAADAPPILRQDFLNSLLAAYRPSEVRLQLQRHELEHLTIETVSDRHFIVFGAL
jgi:ubiquinone/menaquinone biosynthesis C-methylase UbiE